ncbi:MAG: hypothetical protein ACJAVI_004429 [Candidatus Azotimanducaceae bacterium]|jgi:hypothetical protein
MWEFSLEMKRIGSTASKLLPLLALVFTPAYGLNEIQTEVKSVLAQVATINDECWAYTLNGTLNDGGKFLATRDPVRASGKLWLLEQSAGDDPIATREKNFQKGRARDEKAPISAAIDWETVTLLRSDEYTSVYGYTPIARDNEEKGMIENLQGRLYLDTASQELQRIEWTAVKPFSVRFGVSVKHFNLQVNYKRFNSSLLPVTSNMNVKAVAFGLKKIEQKIQMSNTGYFNSCTNTRI